MTIENSSFFCIGQNNREVVVPPQQLRLSESELNEEITKMLSAVDPNAPSNLVRFHFKEKAYKFEPMVDQLATHLSIEGWIEQKEEDNSDKQTEEVKAPICHHRFIHQ